MKVYTKEEFGRINQLKQLVFARQSFDVAIRTSELALLLSDAEEYLPHIYSLAASVAYASPFLSSNGLPALDNSYARFEDKKFELMHRELLEIRHTLYAHRDVVNAKHDEGGKRIQSHAIHFDYHANGHYEIKTFNIRLEKSAFIEIKRLAHYQVLRIDKKIPKIIKHMLKLKQPSVGTHVIGESFP